MKTTLIEISASVIGLLLVIGLLKMLAMATGAAQYEASLDPIIVPPPVADTCEVTYGPLPTPREGWTAWGVLCPKGVTP